MRIATTHTGLAAAIAALTITALTGCGALHPDDYPLEEPTLQATSNPAEVSAKQFGQSWSLDVDHGIVGCELDEGGNPILTFTAPDGTTYALNAIGPNTDRPDIENISNGSVGTLRTFAFTVCDA